MVKCSVAVDGLVHDKTTWVSVGFGRTVSQMFSRLSFRSTALKMLDFFKMESGASSSTLQSVEPDSAPKPLLLRI